MILHPSGYGWGDFLDREVVRGAMAPPAARLFAGQRQRENRAEPVAPALIRCAVELAVAEHDEPSLREKPIETVVVKEMEGLLTPPSAAARKPKDLTTAAVAGARIASFKSGAIQVSLLIER